MTSQRMRSLRMVIAPLVAILALASIGCSSVPSGEAMRVDDPVVASRHAGTVSVHASGGQEFDFRISDEEFEAALRASIEQAGVFAQVVDAERAQYRLDVVLGDFGGIETREMTALWNVSDARSGATLWQSLVKASGRSHHFVGVVRSRRSLEYAAQENIRRGIEELSAAALTRAAPN